MTDILEVRAYNTLSILIALEAGEITEGQAAQTLQTDRVSVREMLAEAIERGKELAAKRAGQ